MRILKVEPGKAPYAKEMEEGLKAIQREIEGLFQPLSMGDGVILCCNDEGKLNGMRSYPHGGVVRSRQRNDPMP